MSPSSADGSIKRRCEAATLGLMLSFSSAALVAQASLEHQQWDIDFGVPGLEFGQGGTGRFSTTQGRVYVSGSFDSIGEISATNLALQANDGWSLAHCFSRAGGKRANNIAPWGGTNWYPLAEGTRYARNDPLGTDNGRVRALTIHQDQLIVAGSFQLAGESHASGIARWDGGDRHSLEPGFPPGSALAIASNGDSLFVGGRFENRCVPDCSSYLTHWDGSRWSPLGQGVLGSVFLLGVDNDHLFASGDFAFAGGKPSRQMALWHLPITLASELTSKGLSISWPASRNYVALERASSLQAGVWEIVEFIPELRDGKRIAALPLSGANTFYRLRQKQATRALPRTPTPMCSKLCSSCSPGVSKGDGRLQAE